MDRRLYTLTLVLALILGLSGGLISSWFLKSHPALADGGLQVNEVVIAKEFRLVGENDRTLAVFGGHPGREPYLPIEGGLRFYNREGELLIMVGVVPVGKPVIAIFDGKGQIIWRAPQIQP
ncbi:MAG: hypothetical protein P8075_07155 [Deltaproteobacteria bacterium]|jgi:hypothetical protein